MTFSLVIQPIKSKKMNKRISMKVQNKSESTNWFDKLWFLFLWFFNFFIFILLNNFQDQSQLFRGTERLTLKDFNWISRISGCRRPSFKLPVMDQVSCLQQQLSFQPGICFPGKLPLHEGSYSGITPWGWWWFPIFDIPRADGTFW